MDNTMLLDKVPPHDEDAERCVLGCLLRAGDVVPPDLIVEDFYLAQHGRIFKAVTAIADSVKPVDCVTVNDWLKIDAERTRKERRPHNGNPAVMDISADYLVSLMESVPSVDYLDAYAEIVRQKALLRDVIQSASEILGTAYGQTRDASELADDIGKIAVKLSDRERRGDFLGTADILQDTFDQIDKGKRGEVVGLRTGFHAFDEMTGGLQPGELWIFAGRPSMGKSTLTMNVSANVATNGTGVAIFSLEVNKRQVMMNMLCSRARVNQHHVKRGQISEHALRALHRATGEISAMPIFVCDEPSIAIGRIRSLARSLSFRQNIGLVIVDYLQLVKGERRERDNRETEVASISAGLKGLARELDVPVIAVSQLSRACEGRGDHRPAMGDLRESGAIEQDADGIAMLFRDAYYSQDEGDRLSELIIAKQRNGPTGVVTLIFNKEYLRFENSTEELDYQPRPPSAKTRAMQGAGHD